MIYDPYKELAKAIVKYACVDYLKISRKLALNKGNRNLLLAEKESIIRFIKSDYFQCISDLNPDYLLRLLKEEEEHGKRNPRRKSESLS